MIISVIISITYFQFIIMNLFLLVAESWRAWSMGGWGMWPRTAMSLQTTRSCTSTGTDFLSLTSQGIHLFLSTHQPGDSAKDLSSPKSWYTCICICFRMRMLHVHVPTLSLRYLKFTLFKSDSTLSVCDVLVHGIILIKNLNLIQWGLILL